ncbi:Adenine phosphoribosyltransferase, putative [Trypanosoma brucei gambiense DAL972]|uniref:adenine phosphoribosyltransferase n=1 Tax=Trypanosoma brucei gambiense (strain MHOM/CI/86/DAL972) TaxID=679716 RepID=C9ZS71_TRYB9|nr:Adenine phosphoribosyltransferase, putative [Trypanosoma brucei gambiense DAL972]CBH12207.1 Adenine phosphoribosyltransferase, putative [Trypanosoma brucei gambiense DAL972]|eukprot:XP_011774490.1 Adenine phosphoribosyltransferase, putative [Trypanosoma brucei gambiense DAL972]
MSRYDAMLTERHPHHFTLADTHPLAKELHANIFGESDLTHANSAHVYDISSLTEKPALFRKVIEFLKCRYETMGDTGPTHIIGVESRGYIIGAPLAVALGIPFVTARVTKRFPSSFVPEGDDLKYLPMSRSIRNDSIPPRARVLIVDDFIGTGSTMLAALRLADIVAAQVVEVLTVCDVASLGGIKIIRESDDEMFKETPIFTLIHFKLSPREAEEQLEFVNSYITRSRL